MITKLLSNKIKCLYICFLFSLNASAIQNEYEQGPHIHLKNFSNFLYEYIENQENSADAGAVIDFYHQAHRAYLRSELDLPGTVDELSPHKFRKQCIDVRNAYHHSLWYLNKLIAMISCVKHKISKGCEVSEKCLEQITLYNEKVYEIFPDSLYEKTKTLKYRWPVKGFEESEVVSVRIGEKIYETNHSNSPFISTILDKDEIGIDYQISKKELCLEHIDAELILRLKNGSIKKFITSYTF